MTAVWTTYLVLLVILVLFTLACLRDMDLPEAVEVGVWLAGFQLASALGSLHYGGLEGLSLTAVATMAFCLAAVLASHGHPAWVIAAVTRDRVDVALRNDPTPDATHLGLRTVVLLIVLMVIVYGAHPAYFAFD